MAKRKTKSLHVGEFRKVKVAELEDGSYPDLDHIGRNSNLIIYDDTLVVEGDLDLDELDAGYAGIVVEGDLTVKGNIVNSCGDTGIYLYVKGRTTANNLIAGGAPILLNTATIKYFTIGHYNGGYIFIEKLTTEVMLNFNHHTAIQNKSDINISINTDMEPKGKIAIHEHDLAGFWAGHQIQPDLIEYYEEEDGNHDDSYHCLNDKKFISHILNDRELPLLEYIKKYIKEGKLRKDDLDLPEDIVRNDHVDVDWKAGVVTQVSINDLEGLEAFCNAIVPTQLKSLYVLILRGFELTEIPEPLKQLKQLTELYITNAELNEIPEWIRNLSQLQCLSFSDNNISKIPEWIGELSQLAVLELDSNKLTAIPECIANLSRLTVLELDKNNLSEIPDWIGSLSRLTRLNLGYNNLTTIPKSIGNLGQLRKLYLYENELTVLPESIGSLTQLTTLNLNANSLDKLPDSIGALSLLTELYLCNNSLAEIPESIENLIQLTDLDLGGNSFTEVPGSIAKLCRLTDLDLSYNELTAIPKWIENLSDLSKLVLEENNFTELPDSIKSRFDLDDQGNTHSDDSSDSDFSMEGFEERLNSVSKYLEKHESTFSSLGKLKKRVIGLTILALIFLISTISFMVAAAFTSAGLRQTMIVLYYLSYSMGLANSLRMDWVFQSMLKNIGVNNKKLKPFTRYTLLTLVSASMAVLLHWIFFWK